MNVAFTLAGL